MKRAQIITVKSPTAGIIQNVSPDVVSRQAWIDGLNIRFYNGRVQTSPGWVKFILATLGSPIRHLSQYLKYDYTDFLVAITEDGFYYYNPATGLMVDATGVTPLSQLPDDIVSSDNAFDLFIFTNNADRIKKWAGSGGNIADLGGLDAAVDETGSGTVDVSAAKALTSFAGFMHLVAPTEDGTKFPQRWRWGRFNVVEGWNNVGTYGQAGFADVTDGPDKFQTCKRLGGDFLALYKEQSIHLAQYVGPPTVWSRRLVIDGIGLMAPNAIATMVNEHIFLGQDNFYIFNGSTVQPIGTSIFDRFLSELNPAKSHLVEAHLIREYQEIMFLYPSGASDTPNRAVVLNYMTGAWAFRDAPFMCMGAYRRTDSLNRWDDDSEAWDDDVTRWDDMRYAANAPMHLGGDVDGYIHDYGNGYSQDGADHDSWVVSPAIDSQDPILMKRFWRILVELVSSGTHNLEINYMAAKTPNEDLNWAHARSLPCDLSTNPWVTIDITARYLFIRFRTLGTNKPFIMTGYGYEFTRRGQY